MNTVLKMDIESIDTSQQKAIVEKLFKAIGFEVRDDDIIGKLLLFKLDKDLPPYESYRHYLVYVKVNDCTSVTAFGNYADILASLPCISKFSWAFFYNEVADFNNPYFGCKSLEEMLVVADLTSTDG